MGAFADALEPAAATTPPAPGRRAPAETPRFTQTGEHTGEIVTGPITPDAHPDWDAVFRHWNLDPDAWQVIDGTLRVNAWEGPTATGTAVFRQYKAQVRRRLATDADVDELVKMVSRWKPRRAEVATEGSTFVVVATDWQVGGEGGSERIVTQLMGVLDGIEARARAAVKAGATNLLLPALGDLVEGTAGQYPAQPYTVDLDLSSQVRVVRRVLLAWLRRLVPLFDRVTVVGIPGNHGRRTSKVETTYADNADLDAVEGVAEVCASTDWGAHVEFVVPRDTLVALVPVSGTNILLGHGDQKQGGVDKVGTLWRDLAFTRWGDADLADILIVGHRHHLRVEEMAVGRWLFQCPSMDCGSRWFAEIGGGTSKPGVLCFTTEGGRWFDLHVVEPPGED